MFLLRILLPLALLFLLGLVIAWMVTKDRRYLVLAQRSALAMGLLVVVLGLLYIFERVLLL